MRIAVDGVVDIRFDTHALQTMTELISSMLAIVVGNHHTSHHEVATHKLIAQTKHIFVVSDAEVGTDLILFDIIGAHHNDDLDRVAQIAQHAELGVGFETRQNARGMVVIKQFATQFHIELAIKLGNALTNVFALDLEIFLVVESYFHIQVYGLFSDVREFKANAFLAVNDLQHEAKNQSCYTQTGEHHQWSSIVELCWICHPRIGSVEHLTNEQWEEPQTNVLDPEDQGICRTNHLGIHELRH